MKIVIKNKWGKFAFWGTLYVLWVIWNTQYLWLLLLPVIFDVYVTKKVHWAFWKKKGVKKQTRTVEWIDAVIFAVIAATFIRTFFFEAYKIPTSSMEKSLLVGDHLFVSKSAYGPRKPYTPLSFPFVHNVMPMTTTKKSFSEAWQRDYFRMKGYRTIKNNDIVVFNFPEGDSICISVKDPNKRFLPVGIQEQVDMQMISGSYYQFVRDYGRDNLHARYNVIHRPIDKTDNYVKRCVGIPGDSLQVIDGQLMINGQPQNKVGEVQYVYNILTDGSTINPKVLQNLGVSKKDIATNGNGFYKIPLSETVAEKLRQFSIVKHVERSSSGSEDNSDRIFPHDTLYKWNQDNFGPIYIPKEGATVKLDLASLSFYERIISHYEANELEVNDSAIYINGELATEYTFKMDYYWMMGDNRHNSLDSRFWGYVPADHIVGRASMIWLSLDSDKSFPANIRFGRMLRPIHMWEEKHYKNN